MAKISTIRCRLWSKSKTQLAKKYGLWNMKWTAKMYFRDHVLIMLVLTKAKCYKPRNSNMSESAFFEQQIACVWYFCIAKQFFRTFPFITLTFATRGAIFCYNDEKAPQFSLFSLLLLTPLHGAGQNQRRTAPAITPALIQVLSYPTLIRDCQL